LRSQRGRAGEDAAAALYGGLGFTILARNWRCRLGELDLVAERDDLVVFCEVKTRSGVGFGGGFEAVTAAKQGRVRRLADLFIAVHGVSPGRIRFDVASVHLGPRGAEVQLFRDAF